MKSITATERFEVSMTRAGYKIRQYNGRNFYSGPAVVVPTDELQNVIRATDIPLQWDQMGKSGLVIYPREK